MQTGYQSVSEVHEACTPPVNFSRHCATHLMFTFSVLRCSSVARRVAKESLQRRPIPPKTLESSDDSLRATLPWGSYPKPDFGAIRASTGLSSKQMDALIREYSPQDRVEICKEREKIVKSLRKLMKTKDMDKLRGRLVELRSGVVPLEETTFVTMVFGHLQLRDGLPEAEAVVAEMSRSDFIHPALKSAVSSFVSSLRTLEQFDAFPNRTAILKSFIPFHEIALQVRKMRILAFRVAMSDRMKKGEIMLPANTEEADDTDLDSFIKDTIDLQDSDS